MPEQRIILAIDSRLLREMLKRVFRKAMNLEVVQEITTYNNALPVVVEHTDAEWIFISLPEDSKLPDWVHGYTDENPLVRFIAISASGDQVKMKSQDREEDLEGLSLKDLINILESNSNTGIPKGQ